MKFFKLEPMNDKKKAELMDQLFSITVFVIFCVLIAIGSYVHEHALTAVAKASIVIEDVKHSIDSTKQELRTNGH